MMTSRSMMQINFFYSLSITRGLQVVMRKTGSSICISFLKKMLIDIPDAQECDANEA